MVGIAVLFLLPAVTHPLPEIMPFYDVDKREHKQQPVWAVPVGKLKFNNEAKEIEAVNHYWNHIISYKQTNAWQTPEETFERGYGDCKDYAIAKYYSLRRLGVPASALKFTVVVWHDKWHAVLIADGLMMDSMVDEIRAVDAVDYYEAAYSVNEEKLWTVTDVK